MCGVGFVHELDKANAINALQSIVKVIEVRGPDALEVSEESSNLILFSRFAIREISLGTQPYTEPQTQYKSVINGELYNVEDFIEILQTRGVVRSELPVGDMQLLGYAIARFGEVALSWARGMFAGFIYRPELHDVFLFRDRVGEKPLHFLISEESIYISSTPFFKVGDLEKGSQISEALLLGHFGEVKNLMNWQEVRPGTFLIVNLVSKSIEREETYWSWNLHRRTRQAELEILDLPFLIEKAVASQLISDQPICTFLSGGLDSAIVSKFARDLCGPGLSSFTLAFPDSKYSEANRAKLTASKLDLTHEVITVSNAELAANIDECINAMPIPIFDTGCLSLFTLCKEISADFRVALTGDGGDELFGGYTLAKNEHLLVMIRRMPRPLRYLLSRILKLFPFSKNSYLSTSMKFRRASDVISYNHLSIAEIGLSPLAGTKLFKKMALTQEKKMDNAKDVTSYYRETILPNVYLQKSDRMGMSKPMEIRSPLLDSFLIEKVLSCPTDYKNKEVLRSIASEFLPSEILNGNKHGFSSPLSNVLPLYCKPQWELSLIGISPKEADSVWREALKGDENAAIASWALLIVDSFIRKYS